MADDEQDGDGGGRSDLSVRSVRRALALLRAFSADHPTLETKELIAGAGLPKTTALRLLHTLAAEGFLYQQPDGRLTVGPALLGLVRLVGEAWQVHPAVDSIMEAVARHSRETTNLYTLNGYSRICVAQHQGPQTIRHFVRIGDALPLWAGASSMVLLSDKPSSFIETVVAQAPPGRTDAQRVRASAARARERAVAVSHGEREAGASSVAAPVTDPHGRIVAALAISGPSPRFTDAQVALFASVVQDAAREISDLASNHPIFGAGDAT
jgi:DNA-binding IclR family transcriptional regulator